MSVTNLALAFAVASYAKAEVKEIKVSPKATKEPKAPKIKSAPAPIPSPNGSVVTNVPSIKMPPKGSLGAHGYLKMMRGAKSHNEKVMALSAYIGYDMGRNFAEQELAANMQARKDIKGAVDISGPSREEIKSANRSAQGYVSGMPDNTQKKIANLLAREINTAEERDNHNKLAQDATLAQDTRALHEARALLEDERLTVIREEIKSLVG